jgi:hypothetical protein
MLILAWLMIFVLLFISYDDFLNNYHEYKIILNNLPIILL